MTQIRRSEQTRQHNQLQHDGSSPFIPEIEDRDTFLLEEDQEQGMEEEP